MYNKFILFKAQYEFVYDVLVDGLFSSETASPIQPASSNDQNNQTSRNSLPPVPKYRNITEEQYDVIQYVHVL